MVEKDRTEERCQCKKLPEIFHGINQSLLVIRAYIYGCEKRAKENTLDGDELSDVLIKIDKHIRLITNKINLAIL